MSFKSVCGVAILQPLLLRYSLTSDSTVHVPQFCWRRWDEVESVYSYIYIYFFYLTYLCLLVLWFKQQKTEWSKVRVDGVEFSHNCWWLTDPTVYISSPSDGDDVCSRRASTILGLGLCIPPSAIFRKRSFAILACKAGWHSDMSDWGQEAGEKDAGVLADGRPIWASSVPGGGPKGPTEPPGRGRVP